tara:strand:- start:15 stop:1070 length:1056 start_codon:yes stop_codon:yes gene_type:complete
MGKKAPTPPDPVALAQAQEEANRLNVYTPQGANVYGNVDDQGQFVPDYGGERSAIQVQETPFQAAMRAQQEGIATDLTGVAGDRVSGLSSDPFSFEGVGPDYSYQMDRSGLPALQALGTQGLQGIPDLGAMPTVDDASRQRIEQSIQGRYERLLAPQQKQARDRVATDLQNRGIPIGSEAYNNAMNRIGQQQSQQLADISDRAIQGGGAEQSRMFQQQMASRAAQFGEGVQARGIGFGERQAMAADQAGRRGVLSAEQLQDMNMQNAFRAQAQTEQLTGRQQRIAELAQLLGASPQQPNASIQLAPGQLDVTSGPLAQYNAQNANYQANLQGLYGLGSAAGTAAGAYYGSL